MPTNYYESEVTFMPRKNPEQVQKPFLERLAENEKATEELQKRKKALAAQKNLLISDERDKRQKQNTISAFRIFDFIMDTLSWRNADEISISQEVSDITKSEKKKNRLVRVIQGLPII